MADDLDRAITQLSNREGTWVARRDAADFLGKVASRARDALARFAQDPDTDVRTAVARALGDPAWREVGRVGALTLEELVRAVERQGKRAARPIEGGFEITVTLKSGRMQKVFVTRGSSEAGAETIRVRSRCGLADAQTMEWALRANDRLPHCSLAIVEDAGQQWFEIGHSLRVQKATPDELRACIKEVAFYGDWAEARLSKQDAL